MSDYEKLPFKGVKEAIIKSKEYANIAIVSSANEKAVLDEWSKHKLLEHVDIVLTQNIGSKAFCIKKLKEKGYSSDNVLMIGDALGDLNSSKSNDVLFYPIMVKKEEESWNTFANECLDKFINRQYIGSCENSFIDKFKANLSN